MRMKLKIHGKFMITVIIPLIIISGAVIMYVSMNNRKMTLSDAHDLIDLYASEQANMIGGELGYKASVINAANFLITDYSSKTFPEIKFIFSEFITNILKDQPKFLAIWMSWELKVTDKQYSKDYGRVRFTFLNNSDGGNIVIDTLDLDGEDTDGLYYQYKQYGKNFITDPYWDNYNDSIEIQMASIGGPLKDKTGSFYGFIAADIIMERFNIMIDSIKPYNGYAFLLSNNGTIIAHPNRDLIGISFYDNYNEVEEKFDISDKISRGEKLKFETDITRTGEFKYISFAPLQITKIEKPWSLGIVVPKKEITRMADRNFIISIIIGTTGIIFISILVWLLSRHVTHPLNYTTRVLDKLSAGNLSEIRPISYKSSDEIGHMSQALNTLTVNLRKIASFAMKIGRGNLKASYKPLGENDVLGNALVKMQSDLIDTNKRLAESVDNAIAATDAKSLFLANMSHEIRTPLNGIIGMTDIMKETELKTEQLEYLNIIEMSGNNLLTIINDILDFSKIESGQIELESIKLNIRYEIGQVVKLLENKAKSKSLYITTEIDKKVPASVFGDPVRIKQILINLINNAIKFTEKGGVTISLSLKDYDELSCTLLFRIIDTGIGITDKGITKLFKSFSQTDISTTREFGGTGLGLAISKKLTEFMNGEIGVESEKGQGSTFWFTAKLLSDSSSQDKSLSPADLNKTVKSTKLSILLAEDNSINRKVAILLLSKLGHTIDEAENGKVAVEKFSAKKYDIILMDIQMPIMDGIMATREVRKIESGDKSKGRIPIIAVTANAIKGDRERFLEAGMDDYISKPFRPEELEDMLQEIVLSFRNNT